MVGRYFLLVTNCLDGSHRLDKYEVQYWLENHGKYITLRQAQKIIEQMDFNADGYVEYSDFLATILGTWLGTTSRRGNFLPKLLIFVDQIARRSSLLNY